jgi:acetylornithine deacetylase/succinyl-diaminopimelate desuccinylase-like protein
MPTPAELDDFFEYLRFPSISADPARAADVRACADWLRARLQRIGLHAEVRETPGHPVVLARNAPRAGLRTVLIYGHYDVQPVDPLELWTSAPFEPCVVDGRVHARGATDNKGQNFAHQLGIAREIAAAGGLPVNLILLLEGEEEVGSGHLAPFLAQYRDELRPDVVVVSDTSMAAPGVPAITCGLRGIVAVEVTLTGPAGDLHSGLYGGAVPNACTELARILAQLHDTGRRVTVPGFYDAVREPGGAERAGWARLPYGDAELLRASGARALAGEAGRAALECIWSRPTAEVNGMWGGYQGEGSKTVLPARAHAKLTFRLVPDQEPDDIAAKVEAHLRALAPDCVTIDVRQGHRGKPYHLDPTGPDVRAAQRALETAFDRAPVLMRDGGSIPIVQQFREILGADTLLLGLGLPDCNLHAPNETFPVEHLDRGAEMCRALMRELAGN